MGRVQRALTHASASSRFSNERLEFLGDRVLGLVVAEMLFNHLAVQRAISWRADSRGLDPDPYNFGPISRHTLEAARKLGILPAEPPRYPITATAIDFQSCHHIVAVKEAEHRALLERLFPAIVDRVEFWHVHDLDCCGPQEAIPHLDREVAGLVERLLQSSQG